MRRRAEFIIGIDEAGRGPLAGPIAVGLCVLPSRSGKELLNLFSGFPFGKDSKKMSARQREFWFGQIRVAQSKRLLNFDVCFANAKDIDSKGVTSVSRECILRLLKKLKVKEDSTAIFLDGGLKAPEKFKHQETVIKGDEKIFVISLASIVAKVKRDMKMKMLDKRFPEYGFREHKGYGTRKHFKALNEFGTCKEHRERFLVKWRGRGNYFN